MKYLRSYSLSENVIDKLEEKYMETGMTRSIIVELTLLRYIDNIKLE